MTDRLDSDEALQQHLKALLKLDKRLRDVHQRAGAFEVRKTEPGFAGMAQVICGQQLSVASARAIWGRFAAIKGATAPRTYLKLSEEVVRASGFSGGKYRTLRAVAEAIVAKQLHLDHIATQPADEAITALTAIKGVGPWTAEIYLMFCAGHPDIFPAGDLALRKAVGHALGHDEEPNIKQVIEIAAAWAPHRATAALLFWRYYAALKQRDGVPL